MSDEYSTSAVSPTESVFNTRYGGNHSVLSIHAKMVKYAMYAVLQPIDPFGGTHSVLRFAVLGLAYNCATGAVR